MSHTATRTDRLVAAHEKLQKAVESIVRVVEGEEAKAFEFGEAFVG